MSSQKEEERNYEVETYITTLSEQKIMIMKIAEQHLETSFDITKSIGFLEWKQSTSECLKNNKVK